MSRDEGQESDGESRRNVEVESARQRESNENTDGGSKRRLDYIGQRNRWSVGILCQFVVLGSALSIFTNKFNTLGTPSDGDHRISDGLCRNCAVPWISRLPA